MSTKKSGGGIGLRCQHSPIVNSNIWIIPSNCEQLRPIQADADALDLGASAHLRVQVDQRVLSGVALTPLLPAVPLAHRAILRPRPDQTRVIAGDCQAFHSPCVPHLSPDHLGGLDVKQADPAVASRRGEQVPLPLLLDSQKTFDSSVFLSEFRLSLFHHSSEVALYLKINEFEVSRTYNTGLRK